MGYGDNAKVAVIMLVGLQKSLVLIVKLGADHDLQRSIWGCDLIVTGTSYPFT